MTKFALNTSVILTVFFVSWFTNIYNPGYFLIPFVKATESQTYPKYGYSPDYSWIAGKLSFQPLEGGCWTLTFSETQKDTSNYFGLFGLDLTQVKSKRPLDLTDGAFVVVIGKIKESKVSMSCPPNIYQAEIVLSSEPGVTPFPSTTPPTRRIEIKPGGSGQEEIKRIPISPDTFQQITPAHAADKIVTHGYNLIDAYIKELPGYTCEFPDGQFSFTLDGNYKVDISPACAYGKIWRVISFRQPDGRTQITFLDGPISGEPGTPNPEAILGAKKTLENFLSSSNMKVKKVFKEDVTLDLSSQSDFQVFIVDLLFGSIKLTKPLASGPIPGQYTLPPSVPVKISPDNEKPIRISGVSTHSKQVKTKVDFGPVSSEVKIIVKQDEKEAQLAVGGETIKTKRSLEIQASRIYLETPVGRKEIKINPADIYKSLKISKDKELILDVDDQEPTYFVKGARQGRLFFVIPIVVERKAKVNAETGRTTSIKSPWWDFLVR